MRIRTVGAAVLVGLLLAGCLPIPRRAAPLDVPPPQVRMRPEAVAQRYVGLPGVVEPHTPARLAHSFALQFRGPEPPDTVLLLMPGLLGGAASLEGLARALVAARPGLQVWTLDRRSNALEDRAGLARALAAGDPRIALRYYLGDGTAPATFRVPADADLAFLGYWGLDVHLGDLAAVVDAAHATAPRVLLGGHSLGAALVAQYAAWRRPDGRLGADTIDGLVLLDGAPGRTGGFFEPVAAQGRRVFGLRVIPSIAELEAGHAPYLGFGFAPRELIRNDVVALFALLEPDARAPPTLTRLPLSNEALAGLTFDDTYAPVALFAPAVGEPVGARYAGNLLAFLLGGADGARSRTVVGAAPGVSLVRWGPGVPPEATDLASMVTTAADRDTDRSEWYFPTRLLLDMAALDVDPGQAPGFAPADEVRVPTLAIGAGRGLVRTLDGFAAYANTRVGSSFTAYVVPGVTHIDLIEARDAPAATLVLQWSQSLR